MVSEFVYTLLLHFFMHNETICVPLIISAHYLSFSFFIRVIFFLVDLSIFLIWYPYVLRSSLLASPWLILYFLLIYLVDGTSSPSFMLAWNSLPTDSPFSRDSDSLFSNFCGFSHINSYSLSIFVLYLSLIHIWRCRRRNTCRSRWSPYH